MSCEQIVDKFIECSLEHVHFSVVVHRTRHIQHKHIVRVGIGHLAGCAVRRGRRTGREHRHVNVVSAVVLQLGRLIQVRAALAGLRRVLFIALIDREIAVLIRHAFTDIGVARGRCALVAAFRVLRAVLGVAVERTVLFLIAHMLRFLIAVCIERVILRIVLAVIAPEIVRTAVVQILIIELEQAAVGDRNTLIVLTLVLAELLHIHQSGAEIEARVPGIRQVIGHDRDNLVAVLGVQLKMPERRIRDILKVVPFCAIHSLDHIIALLGRLHIHAVAVALRGIVLRSRTSLAGSVQTGSLHGILRGDSAILRVVGDQVLAGDIGQVRQRRHALIPHLIRRHDRVDRALIEELSNVNFPNLIGRIGTFSFSVFAFTVIRRTGFKQIVEHIGAGQGDPLAHRQTLHFFDLITQDRGVVHRGALVQRATIDRKGTVILAPIGTAENDLTISIGHTLDLIHGIRRRHDIGRIRSDRLQARELGRRIRAADLIAVHHAMIFTRDLRIIFIIEIARPQQTVAHAEIRGLRAFIDAGNADAFSHRNGDRLRSGGQLRQRDVTNAVVAVRIIQVVCTDRNAAHMCRKRAAVRFRELVDAHGLIRVQIERCDHGRASVGRIIFIHIIADQQPVLLRPVGDPLRDQVLTIGQAGKHHIRCGVCHIIRICLLIGIGCSSAVGIGIVRNDRYLRIVAACRGGACGNDTGKQTDDHHQCQKHRDALSPHVNSSIRFVGYAELRDLQTGAAPMQKQTVTHWADYPHLFRMIIIFHDKQVKKWFHFSRNCPILQPDRQGLFGR